MRLEKVNRAGNAAALAKVRVEGHANFQLSIMTVICWKTRQYLKRKFKL